MGDRNHWNAHPGEALAETFVMTWFSTPVSAECLSGMNLLRTGRPLMPAEPGYADAGYELKAMDCIAKNAERGDVRRLFRIEVR